MPNKFFGKREEGGGSKTNGPFSLFNIWLHWKYRADGETIFRVNEKYMIVYISLLFFLITQYDVCSEEHTDSLSEDWIQCSQYIHEGCTTYREFDNYFYDDCQYWLWFFLFRFHCSSDPLCSRGSGRWFLFFHLLTKKTFKCSSFLI